MEESLSEDKELVSNLNHNSTKNNSSSESDCFTERQQQSPDATTTDEDIEYWDCDQESPSSYNKVAQDTKTLNHVFEDSSESDWESEIEIPQNFTKVYSHPTKDTCAPFVPSDIHAVDIPVVSNEIWYSVEDGQFDDDL